MTAANIQLKIDKAHTKIGQKLGTIFTIYSPLDDINPIDDRNIIGETSATFTLNDQYTKTIGWDVPIWTMYANPLLLKQGDWLCDGTRTFFVLSRLPLLPILVVECPNKIDISTVGYGDGGTGFAPGQTTAIAHNVPCFISTSSTNYSGSSPGKGVGSAGFRNLTVISYLRSELKLNGMSVSGPDGFVGDIVQYDFASLGTGVKFTAQEFQS